MFATILVITFILLYWLDKRNNDGYTVLMEHLNNGTMRQLSTMVATFVLAGLVACEQTKAVSTKEESHTEFIPTGNAQTDIYAYIKASLATDWVRENPELIETEASYFNKEKAKKYFVAPIQISGYSTPFAWDDDLSILRFLLSKDDNVKVLRGTEADPNYKGTKIVWKQQLSGFVWVDNKSYEAPLKDWWLIKESDCPGTITFPTISFEKLFEAPNALTNNLEGLAIIPFNSDFKNIKASDVSIKTKNGILLNGKAYDIDTDGIIDVFLYDEEIDETTYYSRLYLNIGGQWECKHIKLDQVCV